MTYAKDKPVRVVDPDIDRRTLVDAWEQGTDEKTGDRLVVIEGEPGAQRRIRPENVFSPMRLVISGR